MAAKKKPGIKMFNKHAWICIITVFTFQMIGVGYADWADRINVNTVICTGYMDPVFCNFEVIDKSAAVKVLPVVMSEDKKSMNLRVEDVRKGDYITIRYGIKNKGSIPVYCSISEENTEAADIQFKAAEELIECNGYSEGIVKIVMKAVEPGKTYYFPVVLNFRQYNSMK